MGANAIEINLLDIIQKRIGLGEFSTGDDGKIYLDIDINAGFIMCWEENEEIHVFNYLGCKSGEELTFKDVEGAIMKIREIINKKGPAR